LRGFGSWGVGNAAIGELHGSFSLSVLVFDSQYGGLSRQKLPKIEDLSGT
jgi:hypothetical protein